MNEDQRSKIVEETRKLWDDNQGLDAGQIVYERIPREFRAPWGVSILKVAYVHFQPASDIESMIDFANDPGVLSEDQYEAHRIVDKVNRFPYQEIEPFSQTIYTLATNVGKVVYNSEGFGAPFDHHAGWEIGKILKRIVLEVGDLEFARLAWKVFCNEDYIQLDEPISCHPNCSLCFRRFFGKDI